MLEAGDYVTFTNDDGEACRGCITAVADDGGLTIELYDDEMQGTGETVQMDADSVSKMHNSDHMDKAILIPVSEDGDPFKIGDLVAFEGWDVMTPQAAGGGFMGIIRAIAGFDAAVEYLDVTMQPAGNTTIRPLATLREYMLPGAAESGTTKADNPDDYAYVPDKETPSKWKLDISDGQHIAMAITALSPGGYRGQKVAIPKADLPGVIRKIRSAINKLADKDIKQHLLERLDAIDPAKKAAEAAPVTAKGLDTAIEVGGPTTAIKALDDSGDRVGGYLALFGDALHRDLTPVPNPDGTKGEYFTPETNFCLDWPVSQRPMLYHHGLDSTVKVAAVGVIDKVEADDVGVWAEAQLDKRNRYTAKVKELVAKGALGWSSGSVPHLVKKARDGRIMQWPIVEGSATPTPMEPRGTDLVPTKALWEPRPIIQAYKALNLTLPPLLSDAPVDAPEGRQHSGSGVSVPAIKAADDTFKITTHEGIQMEMTQEQLDAAIAAGIQKQKDAETATVKAQQDFEAKVKVEAEKLAAQMVAKTPGNGKPLPIAPVNATIDNKPVKAQVIGNVKYADLSAEDMSYMIDMMGAYARAGRGKRQGEQTALEVYATRFIDEVRGDQDRKLEREISAKALREQATNRLPASTIDLLPYKSMDDVFANDYDKSVVEAAIKANELDNTAQTSFGLEWVPTIWNNQLWRRVRISNPYGATIQTIEMPTNPFKLPLESTDPTVYYVAEGTDQTMLVLGSGNTLPLSKIGSGAPSITAKKLGLRVGWSQELLEDSVLIPVITYYRYQAQRVLQNYVDDTIVNGDVATGINVNVNLIDGTPTTGTSYLALDGLRKYALVTNTAQGYNFGGGAPTLPGLRAMRKLLSKHYAVDLPNLYYVMGFETYMKALNMPEFETWQNLGVPGSNVTGLLPGGSADTVADTPKMVGVIDGIPVYVSAQIGLANNGGNISATPANNTLGTVTLHHKTRWFLGYRRNIQLDVVPLGYFSDTYQLWATVRFGLVSFDTTSAVVGYNILV